MPGFVVGASILDTPNFDMSQSREGYPTSVLVRQNHLEKLGSDFVGAAWLINKGVRHITIWTALQEKAFKTSREVIRDIWR
jgi:hypothetical protein